jgi:hypothetical protein
MHYGIIESINQGNFPPEMPYYSGVQMKYHYFVDFHTAIIEKVMEGFHPRLLVVINSIFAFLFAYSLYLIAFYITNNKKAAIYAGIIGVFGAGFSYFLFFHDFATYNGFSHPFKTFLSLLSHNYSMEYGKFFLIPPVFDNMLQQRSQMMGIPCLIVSFRNVQKNGSFFSAFPYYFASFYYFHHLFCLWQGFDIYAKSWLVGK